MRFSEVKCPKCKSSSFDYMDETPTFSEVGSVDVEFMCQDCGCGWLQGRYIEYTEEQEILEGINEDQNEEKRGKDD